VLIVIQTVLGPWRVLNAGTGSHAEILVLLALIRRVERWVRGVYWPWLRGNVLDGLEEGGGQLNGQWRQRVRDIVE
jgi:hypothetical protein